MLVGPLCAPYYRIANICLTYLFLDFLVCRQVNSLGSLKQLTIIFTVHIVGSIGSYKSISLLSSRRFDIEIAIIAGDEAIRPIILVFACYLVLVWMLSN